MTGCASAQSDSRSGSFTGTVELVWEDGFQLVTESRSIRVASYDLCGDQTARSIAVGDRLRVSGEFERGELDAFTVDRGGQRLCK